ncbi:lysophospholipase L1-like esterase [Virgibacillus natechei]|uniref:Lysophospholipase L1-like esterase n=1 Tax=Virgibacillus natechei TaxID=1216297 RepID=A0ABS4IFN7_9BACI|nr:GDSL-type esterase/lipase family protein [Virgibacillus natechei]MBP1969752.1 lysophospholipase L1-like esterase [Virgibacillus natechei]UZD12704.1 GDSL-type esterase/lipase family protein [Virgibacillus natechei]
MKKKNFIIAFIVFLIGAGIFIWINQSSANLNNIAIPEDEQTALQQHEEEEEHIEEETDNTDESQEEEENTEENQFSTIFTEAVQGTIDFFTNGDSHVVAIGDSLTQGVGASHEQGGYVGILDRTINAEDQIVSFDNFGIRGNRSDQLLERLDNPELSTAIEDADTVLITIGANDIMKVVRENFTNLNIEDFAEERNIYEETLDQIFTKIKNINPNTEIYLLGFYNPWDEYFQDIEELGIIVEEWNNTGNSFAEENEDITFIPMVDVFENAEEHLFADDNFHPNDLGYQRMASRVLDYLTNQEG